MPLFRTFSDSLSGLLPRRKNSSYTNLDEEADLDTIWSVCKVIYRLSVTLPPFWLSQEAALGFCKNC